MPFSLDVLGLIGYQLRKSPMSVIWLAMTSKSMRRIFREEDGGWWDRFFEWVVVHEESLRCSRYLRKLKFMEKALAGNRHRALCLVYGKRCQFCGNRYGHHLIKSLKMRACKPCMEDKLLSNGTLYFKYGLSFYDFFELYAAQDGLIVPSSCMDRELRNVKKRMCTQASLHEELSQYKKASESKFIYMWKPDIERILSVDMREVEKMQVQRILAARFLSARIVRFYNQRAWSLWRAGFAQMIFRQRWIERLKPFWSIPLPKCWIPGGALYAYYDLNSHRRLTDFWWRPGFGFERCERINQIVRASQCLEIQTPIKRD